MIFKNLCKLVLWAKLALSIGRVYMFRQEQIWLLALKGEKQKNSSACSMWVKVCQRDALQARVSGGILLQKSLKNMCSEIHFGQY